MPSVAVTLTETGPVNAAGGVPVKVWVAALNFSHVGNARAVGKRGLVAKSAVDVPERAGGNLVGKRHARIDVMICDELRQHRRVVHRQEIEHERIGGRPRPVAGDHLEIQRRRRNSWAAVPVKVWVAALNVEPGGQRGTAGERSRDRSGLPPSGSLKLLAGSLKENAWSSNAIWSGSGRSTTGASGVGVMVRRNVSSTMRLPSSTLTTMSSTPLKSFGGTPANVRVTGLKVSHPGNG